MEEKMLATLSSLKEHVNIAKSSDVVYKEQCFYSFDAPNSPLGIFVNLYSFHCYGYKFVKLYYLKTGYRLYLNIRQTKVENVDISSDNKSGDNFKPTKLGLGIEGGFLSQEKFSLTTLYQLVLLPEFIFIPISSELPSPIYESLLSIIENCCDLQVNTFDSWEQKLLNSIHSETLIQLQCVEKIPPSGWKCDKCDFTTNLWLNLTDGSILCGRKQFDGSGGNNHALAHFSLTKYPLAVKLGTITSVGGDVFSYDEDDMVIDTNLLTHLSHFGINASNMHKTDKTMNELQIDLNIQIGEASIIQESDSNLIPLKGPGFTGLNNLGNSCYINSVLQVLFALPCFSDAFHSSVEYMSLFSEDNVSWDFLFQLKKLARGLCFRDHYDDVEIGNSSFPINKESLTNSLIETIDHPISPIYLRAVVGKGHREFSSSKQQDAQEYLLHFLNKLEKTLLFSSNNICDVFKFTIQDRLECLQTNHVQISTRIESILTLSIPNTLDETEVLAKYNSPKNFDCGTPENPPILKPKVTILECLANFNSYHVLSDYLSPVNQKFGKVSKSSSIQTFPEYLFIHFGKFYVGDDWVPKKLDVEILGTENLLDIEFLRSPKTNLPTSEASEAIPVDLEVLAKLLEMGCDEELSKRALAKFSNDFESSLSWILNGGARIHVQDNTLSDVDPALVNSITEFGFNNAQAVYALKKTNCEVERAVDFLFSHTEEIASISGSENIPRCTLSDGIGRYNLVSIISHIGPSTMSGHYVAHVLKNGRWVLFNDEKVSESKNPPFHLGYLYLYKRN